MAAASSGPSGGGGGGDAAALVSLRLARRLKRTRLRLAVLGEGGRLNPVSWFGREGAKAGAATPWLTSPGAAGK